MDVIKIIKENKLNIPIGTFLHAHSFFDQPERDNPKIWESIKCYVWRDFEGDLHIVDENKIYPELYDCYVNCICLDWSREFLFEGDEYWKVFIFDEDARLHKLEFDGKKHSQALLFKPYKDKVRSNTNFRSKGCQRFKTQKEAEVYCFKVINKIPIH